MWFLFHLNPFASAIWNFLSDTILMRRGYSSKYYVKKHSLILTTVQCFFLLSEWITDYIYLVVMRGIFFHTQNVQAGCPSAVVFTMCSSVTFRPKCEAVSLSPLVLWCRFGVSGPQDWTLPTDNTLKLCSGNNCKNCGDLLETSLVT